MENRTVTCLTRSTCNDKAIPFLRVDHPPAHRLGQIFTGAAKLSLTRHEEKKKKKENHTAYIHPIFTSGGTDKGLPEIWHRWGVYLSPQSTTTHTKQSILRLNTEYSVNSIATPALVRIYNLAKIKNSYNQIDFDQHCLNSWGVTIHPSTTIYD